MTDINGQIAFAGDIFAVIRKQVRDAGDRVFCSHLRLNSNQHERTHNREFRIRRQ